MIKDFLREHGNGFWLHGLAAVAVVLAFWYFFDMALFGAIVVTGGLFWREVKQHSLSTVWTFHRILEWGTPLIAALLTWVLLT
jgi:hypothetical protein